MVKPTIKEKIKHNGICCPRCSSSHVIKNGRSRGKQRYRCKDCHRYFQEVNNSSNLEINQQIPAKVIILLTSHRSGSTWLSDALRCHPAIEYDPTPIIYEELGLYGRRYPGDLSNQRDCTYEIEVQPGKRDKIPQFNVLQDLKSDLQKIQFESYAIEKCHPSFFDFDPELFWQKINHLESLKVEVQLVYLVREPTSLITSFMNYQERKPSWYKNIAGEDLINFIIDTYKCIAQILPKRLGVVLNYSDLRKDTSQTLLRIYKKLWSNLTPSQEEYLLQISELALKYTNRQQRVTQTNSPFLGQQEGKIQGGDKKYQDFFTTHQELMEQCYGYYEAISDLATK